MVSGCQCRQRNHGRSALSEQFELDARCDQPFLVLTLAAGAIATLGLPANSSAVVIGAMLIAPWMLPLRAAAFGILQGRLLLVGRALLTLLICIAITVALSVLLGAAVGLPILRSEVAARTQPNLLDLGVALVAGAIAAYAAVSSKARKAAALDQIQQAITASLNNRTITLGQDSELINVRIDWSQNPPLIRAAVRVANSRLPTPRQVAAVQNYINQQQPIRYRLIVQRVSVDVIGPETEPNPPELVPQDPTPPVETIEHTLREPELRSGE